MAEKYVETPYDPLTLKALQNAQSLASGNKYTAMPSYVPSQQTAPVQTAYAQYSPIDNLQQVQTPRYQSTAGQSPNWSNFSYSPYSQNVNTNANWNDWSAQSYNGTAPTYKGLMNGDYEALQKALTTPGQLSAQSAYNQGYNNLNNTMGGNGLYGSSIMQNQATNNLDKVYQDALATNSANAAATRYAMQQTDLTNMNAQKQAQYLAKLQENATMQGLMANQNLAKNEFSQDNADRALAAWQSKLAENTTAQGLMAAQNLAKNDFASNTYGQNISREQDLNQFAATLYPQQLQAANDQYKAGLLSTQDKRAYDVNKLEWDKSYQDQLTAWKNAQAYEKYQYDLAKRADQSAYQEKKINEQLALAGQGAPLVASANSANQAYLNYLASIDATKQAYSSAKQAGWLGAAGTIGAGLLKNTDLMNSIGSGVSDAAGSLYESLFGSTVPTV